MTQLREITMGEEGLFEVTTGASMYVIDTKSATVVRIRVREENGPDFSAAAALRRDEETIGLIDIRACIVGQPMVLFLDVRRDGIVTMRRSTPVQAIRRLRPATPAPVRSEEGVTDA